MITVLGSINIDMTFPLEHLPAAGETVLTASAHSALGGKGANQAVAAARVGADVRFIGCVGADAFGERARRELAQTGVDVSGLAASEAPTGLASIFVDRVGRNAIAVALGANGSVTADMLRAPASKRGSLLVMQMEIATHEVAAAIVQAKRFGMRVLLNLAPARPLPIEVLQQVDILVLNEHEAAALIGYLDPRIDAGAAQPIEQLRVIGAATGGAVIITLGSEGAVLLFEGTTWQFSALAVTPIDTTGAGDCFVGNVAAALSMHMSLVDAVGRGVVAGSLACLGLGAQASYPGLADIEAKLDQMPPPRTLGGQS
ncbi:MAG: ribokinase [Hyphomicrobiaceae bacterium]